MAVSKERVLFKEQGVLVTYERFVEPEGKEYRIEDILSVDLEVVEEEANRPPIRWWRTVGGSAIIGIIVAFLGGFAGFALTAGIMIVLAGVAVTWWSNRIRSAKFKVYHVIITLPTRRQDRQEHRIISSTSRFFSERLKVALERAMVERPARYEGR
jgi:hypothetical protein